MVVVVGGGGGIPQHKPAIGVCAACMDLVFYLNSMAGVSEILQFRLEYSLCLHQRSIPSDTFGL